MLPEPDDIAILAAIAGGDRDAVGLLYDRYACLLLALGRRIVSAPGEAEDVLQTVFQALWREAGELVAEPGSARTWLLFRMRRLTLERRATSAPAPCSGGGLSALAWTELTEHERRVLELGTFEGLSAAQIAERLGASTETIRSRLRAGLTKLSARLAPKSGVGA